MDVYDEVLRNNLVLVLPNVLWTQLHLASLNVIAPLDEGRVEHDAAQNFVREACVFENYLHVALQNHASLLLFGKKKDYSVFFLAVLLLCRISEDLSDVKPSTTVDLEEGDTATTRDVGYLDKLNSSESLSGGRLNFVAIARLKVIEVA